MFALQIRPVADRCENAEHIERGSSFEERRAAHAEVLRSSALQTTGDRAAIADISTLNIQYGKMRAL